MARGKNAARNRFERHVYGIANSLFPFLHNKLLWKIARKFRRWFSNFYSKKDGFSPWYLKCLLPGPDASKELWWLEHNSAFWMAPKIFEIGLYIIKSELYFVKIEIDKRVTTWLGLLMGCHGKHRFDEITLAMCPSRPL